jgi:drug/metabolite transporter (DMT)-like permease
MTTDAPAAAAPPMRSSDWAMLIALSVLWGGSFFFVGVAVREWPPLTIVLARVAIAAAALWAVVAALCLPVRRDRAALAAAFGMGLLNNAVPFGPIVWAQGSLPSGLASILNATTPLWAVLVAHAAGAERASPHRVLGVAIGFAGVAVMMGAADAGAPALPVLAMLAATLSYALAGVFGRCRLAPLGIPPLVAAAGQVTAATALLLPAALLLERPWALPPPDAATLAAVGALGLFSTALAYLLYFRLLASSGPVNLLLVTLLIPVSAVLLGTLLLGEEPEARQGVGMAAIALGLAVMDGRLLAWLTRRRRAAAAAP